MLFPSLNLTDNHLSDAITFYNEQVFPDRALTSQRVLGDTMTRHALSDLVKHVNSKVREEVYTDCEKDDRVTVIELFLPHAGDWLDCRPSKADDTILRNDEMDTLLKVQLLQPVMPIDIAECTLEKCGRPFDAKGHHAVTCNRNGDQTRVHDCVKHFLGRLARWSKQHCKVEPNGVYLNHPDRRPDLLLDSFDGKRTAVDVTGVSPHQSKLLNRYQAANIKDIKESPAAMYGNKKKIAHYQILNIRTIAPNFVPFAFSKYGALAPAAIKFFSLMMRDLAAQTEYPLHFLRNNLYPRLSIIIRRGLCNSIFSRSSYAFPE